MNKAIEKLVGAAENLDWKCTLGTQEYDGKKEQYLEFETNTPAGEDFIFTAWGQTAGQLAQDVFKYAEDFDIDEHVKLNLGARGAPGVVALVDDAREIQKMLDALAEALLEVTRK